MDKKEVLKKVGRGILSLLIIVFAILFVITITLSTQITQEKFYDLAKETARSIYIDELNSFEKANGNADMTAYYQQLKTQCDQGIEKVPSGFGEMTLSCTKVYEVGSEGILEHIFERYEKQLEYEIEFQLDEAGASEIFWVSKFAVWFIGAITLALIFVLYTLSVPRYKFYIDFGFAALIAGLPFLIFRNLEFGIQYNWSHGINLAIATIIHTLTRNFLITFIIGIIILIIGIIWLSIYVHKSHRSRNKDAIKAIK